MVVSCLHHVKQLTIFARGLTKAGAIVTCLQLDDPDTFTCRSTVLLDHTRLEFHGLLEACAKLCFIIVGLRVFQANVHLGNLAESILGTHLFHHIWRWPGLDSFFAHCAHAIVELLLITSICLDLAWVAPDN